MGAMGIPVVQYHPGDCFVWGQPAACAQLKPDSRPGELVRAPVLVPGTQPLDICEVCCIGVSFEVLVPMPMMLCGLHVVMLTKQGDVYVCGSGARGRLGTGHALDVLRTQQYNNAAGTCCSPMTCCAVLQVATGPAHVVMLTKQGDVYAWGSEALHA